MKTAIQKPSIFASDPFAFIESLALPSPSGERRFGDCMADFQRKRFKALTPALLALAAGAKPDIGRHCWDATKGASKDSDAAAGILWALAFSPRPLTIQVGAADQSQADELRKAAKARLRPKPWLSSIELTLSRLGGKAAAPRLRPLPHAIGESLIDGAL